MRIGLIPRTFLLCMLWLFGRAAQAEMGGDFSLTDQDEQPFSTQQLRGKVVLLAFGYTFCPDICPTTLSEMAQVFNALGDRRSDVRGIFVTIDPQRDTPKILKQYVGYFDPAITGLTGTPAEIAQVVSRYRVRYQRHDRADGQYSMDHSANLFILNPRGMIAAVVPYGMPAEHILEVVRGVLSEMEQRVLINE